MAKWVKKLVVRKIGRIVRKLWSIYEDSLNIDDALFRITISIDVLSKDTGIVYRSPTNGTLFLRVYSRSLSLTFSSRLVLLIGKDEAIIW